MNDLLITGADCARVSRSVLRGISIIVSHTLQPARARTFKTETSGDWLLYVQTDASDSICLRAMENKIAVRVCVKIIKRKNIQNYKN